MDYNYWRIVFAAGLGGFGWFVFGTAVAQYFVYTVQTVLAYFEFHRSRKADRRVPVEWIFGAKAIPGISLLVPAHNEEKSIVENIRSLLTLRYPRFEIIVVNDGSKDGTWRAVVDGFGLQPVNLRRPHAAPCKTIRGIYRHRNYPNLLFIDKENGGKSDALNAGLNYASHPLFCGVDADSLLDHDSLLKAVRPFIERPASLIAVGGTIRIANGCEVRGGMVIKEKTPRKLVPLFQIVEYLRAFLIARLAYSRMNTVSIISGAFGLFKRSAVLQVGGYTHGTVGEDMDLIVKLHRHFRERDESYDILFVPDPVCWTEAPESLTVLRRQRTRWQRGLCEVLWRHRDMLFRPRFGRVGAIGLPMFVLFDVIGPFLDVAGLLIIPPAWFFGLLSFEFMLAYFSVVAVYGVFLSMMALVMGELLMFKTTRKRDMAVLALAAIVENFGYRQLNLLWRIEGVYQFFRRRKGWGEMTRVGLGSPKSATNPSGP